MGIVHVPSYANRFMAQFVEKYIYSYMKDTSLLYYFVRKKEQLMIIINELDKNQVVRSMNNKVAEQL